MKTRRIISSITVIATALSANCFTAFAQLEDHGTPYPETAGADLENAKSKPVIRVTKRTIASDEAPGQTVTIRIDLEGENVDEKYCVTAFHVYWDDRLEIIPKRNGKLAKTAIPYGAFEEIGTDVLEDGNNGMFIIATGNEDRGYTGTMCEFDVQIPADAQFGDVYPIDVCYVSKNGKTADLFTNNASDADGKMMQDYFFLKGINSSQNPSDDDYLKSADATFADGYIAIGPGNHCCTTETRSTVSTVTVTSTTGLPASSTASESSVTQPVVTNIFGDINGDNIIDGRDATALLTYYAKTSTGYKGTLIDFINEQNN